MLPFNQCNGMPENFVFQVKTAQDIKRFVEMPQSTLVYIIVAQPLAGNAPPFILQIFGSINRFKSSDVLKRWAFTERELKKYDNFIQKNNVVA